MKPFDITVALTPNAREARKLTLVARTETEREDLMGRIGASINTGKALVVNVDGQALAVVVNPAHIVYAE